MCNRGRTVDKSGVAGQNRFLIRCRAIHELRSVKFHHWMYCLYCKSQDIAQVAG